MNILDMFDQCIERMQDEDVSLQEYINSNSVKSVTDAEVKTGVDRLIYNHALNKTQVVKICSTSMPTFNLVEKRMLEEGRVNEPFIQGQSNMYNRFDLAAFMDEFSVPKYSDNYSSIVVGIANHKGGVGKSTSLRTLATATALDTALNTSVVIVDLDPQGSCGLQGQPRSEDAVYLTIADIALRDIQKDSPFYSYAEQYGMSPEEVVLAAAIPTHLPNLFIYSAFPDDERFTDYYHSLEENEKEILISQLSDFIIPILKEKFGVIYIDSPPQDSPITWSGMKATEILVTPIAPKALDYLSTRNFIRFTRDRIVQLNLQDKIKEWKILPVMVDYNDRTHILTLDRIRRCYTDRLTNNVIEQSELFYAADNLQRTIYDIQKTECRDNKYTSMPKYEQALNSSNSVYREFRSVIQNLAVKGR
ncbi:ParA family protein [Vibrio parahaemolyticus]|nr:ParA family protein [Vibrio parahaemolyticus]EHK6027563.1 ParA family protein [Vibrio parahaemolyticus]EJE8675998.1 ParA family protein [Vibrio parahaemolyticus]